MIGAGNLRLRHEGAGDAEFPENCLICEFASLLPDKKFPELVTLLPHSNSP
jgi:hypothetical protein